MFSAKLIAAGFPQWIDEQISYAVFCVEGAYIDRELIFDGSQALKIDSIEHGLSGNADSARAMTC
jgi:hypothetical protein